ncbi:MAG: hypothetical protein IH892_18380 [Planctomycetes bacterium]|nr:hypothetical protein [Planctomycetota bacterium]
MSKKLFILAIALALVMGQLALAQTPLKQDAGPDGIVSIEAENFDENVPAGVHFWEFNTDPTGFSGDGFMRALPDGGGGGNRRLNYQVDFVKTGIHYVWVRGYRTSGNDDSCHVGLDDDETTSDRIQAGNTNNTWQWSNNRRDNQGRAQVDVQGLGVHILHVRMREDGWRFDKIVLTTNPNFTPADLGPEESPRGAKFKAGDASPGNDALDVPWYIDVLSWSPGEFANTHNVYFSTNFADVNDRAASALVAEGLTDTSQAIQTDLETTYYWAVDEVNGAPDFTVHAGDTWSFTVEDFANLVTNVSATADSQFNADTGPEKAVNGSGFTDGLHGTTAEDMWQSAAPPATIEFVFDNAYVLHEMHVWNQNQLIEGLLGFGAQDVVLEVSANGSDFVVMEGVGPFNRAPGAGGYAANTTVPFNGTPAKAVRLTITSNYGPLPNVGLSEVQFTAIPVYAREPQPADGATDVDVDTTLGWRSGRQVDRHELHLGTDPNDLPQVGSVSENSFDVLDLDLQLGQTYTWRVDEVNDATDPSIRMGDVWSFATADNIVVDDMEGYRDEEFLEIWATWIDGFGDPANNGALVGANPLAGDYAPERGIVHGGNQSLPIWFDNGTAAISEATRTFNQAQNWTRSGIQTLSLFVYKGDDNSGGDLYLKINNTKVPLVDNSTYPAGYNPGWVQYHVDLTSLDVSNVSSLTIGVEGPGAQGVIYVDDIRLYAVAPALATLVSPVGSVIEAESGAITAPFAVLSDRPEASGGQYIHTDESVGNSSDDPPARDNGWAVYTINIPADGNYQIAFRGAELDSDSFWVNIPGMVVNDDDLDDSGFVRSNGMFSGQEFVWDFVRDAIGVDTDPIVFTLTAGQHELQITRREDGTALDAIAIFAVD